MKDDQNPTTAQGDGSGEILVDDSIFKLPSRPIVGFRTPAKGEHDALVIGKPIVVETSDTYFEFTPRLPNPKDDVISPLLGYEGLDLCTPAHFFRALYSVVNLANEKEIYRKNPQGPIELKLRELLATFMGGKRVANLRDKDMLRLVYQLVNMLPSSTCNEFVFNQNEEKVNIRQGRFIHLDTGLTITKNITGEATFNYYSIRDSLKDEANLLYLAERRGEYWEETSFIHGSLGKKVLIVGWRDYVDRQISTARISGEPIGRNVTLDGREYDGRTVTVLRLSMSVLAQLSGTAGDRLKIFRFRKEFEDYASSFACVIKIDKDEGEWKTVRSYLLYIELATPFGGKNDGYTPPGRILIDLPETP